MTDDKNYTEAIEGLKRAIAEEQRKIAVCNDNIHAFETSIERLKVMDKKDDVPHVEVKKGNVIVPKNGSLIGWVVNQLHSDDCPQPTKPLYNKYCKVNPNPPSFITFSGTISQYLKNPDTIRRYTIEGNPQSTRNWIGIPSWFENNKLKKEYIEKIKATSELTEVA